MTLAGIAIITNALTWLNIALLPVAFICGVLVFPLFAGGLLSYLGEVGVASARKGWSMRDARSGMEMWNRILDGLPRQWVVAAAIFAAYVFINFFGTVGVASATHTKIMAASPEARLITGHAAIFLLVAAGLFRATRRHHRPGARG